MNSGETILLEKSKLMSETPTEVKNLFVFSKDQENDFTFEVRDSCEDS